MNDELKAALAEEFKTALSTAIAPLKEENEALKGRLAEVDEIRERFDAFKEEREAYVAQIFEQAQKPAEEQKGIVFARIVRSLASGRGNMDRALAHARKMWPNDARVEKALMASDLEGGGVMITPEFSQDIIELLRAGSVLRSLNPTTLPMNAGTITVPKITGGSTATYSGENLNIAPSEPTTGQLVLTAKKLTALVPISNDLLRQASTSVDAVVRDDLVSALSERSDLAFIRGDGTQHTPRGLRNWAPAANVIPSASADSSPTVAEMVTDLGALRLALRAANVPFRRPGYIMSPRTEQVLRDAKDANSNFLWRDQMNAGNLEGYPFRVTTQIPENLGGGSDESELYFAEFSDVVVADTEGIMIDASDSAAYWDGSAVQAAFSRDQTVIRAISEHDLGMRHEESVAVITALLWAIAP